MASKGMLIALFGASVLITQVPSQGASDGRRAGAQASDAKANEEPPVVTELAGPEKSGRGRDPFKGLASQRKSAPATSAIYPPGKRGLVIDEIKVMGIARSVDGEWIAVVDNRNRGSYFLRDGDRLFNGTVSKVMQDQIVFAEYLAEGPGRSNSREIVKRLVTE